jgi:hypothetical protein
MRMEMWANCVAESIQKRNLPALYTETERDRGLRADRAGWTD